MAVYVQTQRWVDEERCLISIRFTFLDGGSFYNYEAGVWKIGRIEAIQHTVQRSQTNETSVTMKFCKPYFPNLENCISQIKWIKIKNNQLEINFVMVVVSLMAK